jgi:hypothetical protein
MTPETLGMDSEQRISGSDRRTFLKRAGDTAASLRRLGPTYAQQDYGPGYVTGVSRK